MLASMNNCVLFIAKIEGKNGVNANKSELSNFAFNVMINVTTISVQLEYKLQKFYWRFKTSSPKTIRLIVLHLQLLF